MASYPETPPGWTEVQRRHLGPFSTHVTVCSSGAKTCSGSGTSRSPSGVRPGVAFVRTQA